MDSYVKEFLFIIWEIIVNIKSNLNDSILYSFTGRFEMATKVLDNRWLLLYVAVFIYVVWDSYRSTVDLNKLSVLAEYSKSQIIPVSLDSFEVLLGSFAALAAITLDTAGTELVLWSYPHRILFMAVFAFIAEPLLTYMDLYRLYSWRYFYSFPIYITLGIILKLLSDWLWQNKNRVLRRS